MSGCTFSVLTLYYKASIIIRKDLQNIYLWGQKYLKGTFDNRNLGYVQFP